MPMCPARLHVENLKRVEGEIALKVGTNKAFGVINVGDASKLATLCETYAAEMVVKPDEFGGSLFQSINDKNSAVNILIGSKKFTEGWSSWRVSTMGLMNIGRTEGAEIIQLFGRGVRLKGYQFSLKRSTNVPGIRTPAHMSLLETLNVFGVRADYMRQFKEYLEAEGAPTGDPFEIQIPTKRNWTGAPSLMYLAVPDDVDFKKAKNKPTLGMPPSALLISPVVVDWYPRIRVDAQGAGNALDDDAVREEHKLSAGHIAFMDIDALYLALIDYKNAKAWYNFNISRDAVRQLLDTDGWYKLLISKEYLTFTGFDRVRLWQEIALALLKKYCDRFYAYQKAKFESPYLKYVPLKSSDPNINITHTLRTDGSKTQLTAALKELFNKATAGNSEGWQEGALRTVCFGNLIYEPLLELTGGDIQISPPPLNKWEGQFVDDLRVYVDRKPTALQDRDVYLLRNQSRGRGLGFFEAGKFFPDFILWIVERQEAVNRLHRSKRHSQLARLRRPSDSFRQKCRQSGSSIWATPDIRLRSFILSNTGRHQVNWAQTARLSQVCRK